MAFYVVDMRSRLIQRLKEQDDRADNPGLLLIKASSAKMAWAKAVRASYSKGNADCNSCGHRYCGTCEDCSLAQRYSDYWICHTCGALNPRIPSVRLREVSNGLGQN